MTAIIRTAALPSDFRVKGYVQAFADRLQAEFGIDSFGTYAGHQATMPDRSQGNAPDRAIDAFITDKALGDRIAEWACQPAIYTQYHIDYHMWWRRIWNPEIAKIWRGVPDRGSKTANHEDHIHFSFDDIEEEFLMGLSDQDQTDLARRVENIQDAVARIEQGNENFIKDITHKLDQLLQKP